jgi:hypothetical protein
VDVEAAERKKNITMIQYTNFKKKRRKANMHNQQLPNIQQNLLHQSQFHRGKHNLPLNLHLG